MKYIVTINDKNYEVEVERGQATIVKTTPVAAPAPQPAAAPAAPAAPTAPAAQPVQAAPANVSGEPVKAPMPGTILDIKVNPGASVKEGDILIILEAMKMENEILAPRNGVVSQILTSKGASVSTGDVLLTLN
ncbi:MAG: biotin/lipoyl-binding protein [Clostridiaceae bacterium]|nr:biotin/lipoyl-binding protein [Clostridiaceae bacterium]